MHASYSGNLVERRNELRFPGEEASEIGGGLSGTGGGDGGSGDGDTK